LRVDKIPCLASEWVNKLSTDSEAVVVLARAVEARVEVALALEEVLAADQVRVGQEADRGGQGAAPVARAVDLAGQEVDRVDRGVDRAAAAVVEVEPGDKGAG
jgi:hypothetical protein